ncbi:hypothetical protein [Allobaculum sp. Allo2]|nr:hypothetical protein [Allobaculum sp. Allo2]UNT92897.1 hypothetical protein KWG61_12655 [Allobaculum sp. Allo2]
MDYSKIIDAVKEAGKFAHQDHLQIAMKGEADFVTQVDLSISEFLKKN